jgi:ribosomal protein S18 acetylase RimI-like enzyme
MLLLNEWTSQVTTRGGVELNVRPASPDDKDRVLTFLQASSAADLRFRFLSAVKPTEDLARILTDVDHLETEDLIAFDARDGSIAATAMIAKGEAPDLAEVAILVRSDLTELGIGWEMLRQASDYAKARGYTRIECIESSSNDAAIALEREQGFRSKISPGNSELTILSRNLA